MGDTHYAEERLRANKANVAGALLLNLLIVTCIWGDWRSVLAVAGIQLLTIAFNVAINKALLQRLGVRRAELLRAIGNAVGCSVAAHVAGWPYVSWLWLPFTGLVNVQDDRRFGILTTVMFCSVVDAAGLRDGVPWIYPFTFSAFALLCAYLTATRYDVIRNMLARSDEQRERLERANAEIRAGQERLAAENQARLQAEAELMQAQKLEAVGRLANGIAHEINTPVQFVGDSLQFLRDASRDLLVIIDRQRRAAEAVEQGGSLAEGLAEAAAACEELDLGYLAEQIPPAFARASDGLQRIAVIVRSMKDFAHPDHTEMALVDLNAAIQSTLTIARSEYKHVAELVTDFAQIPPVLCHRGEVNQVVLNLVVNAAHAVADAAASGREPGRIRVSTRVDDGHVVVSVADNGTGIPVAIRPRIFEPFFTTKEVGRGTGQGLAIARSVAGKHDGSIWFDTELGAGTTFHLRLPLEGGRARKAA